MRAVCALLIVSLLSAVPAAAEPASVRPAPAGKSVSNGKRIAWTLVGAAGGFAAGLFIGLNQFDDAINSDRKVWTAALVGAAAGGIAGNILSRNVGPAYPGVGTPRAADRRESVGVSWHAALGGTDGLAPPPRGQSSIRP